MDVEKTIQFILEQNAVNTVQIAQLREVVLAHESDLEAHTEWKIGMSHALQDLATQMKENSAAVALQQARSEEKLADLAEKHAGLAEKLAKVTEKQGELVDLQQTTQENLNILIRTVQDMIPRLPK